MTTGTALVETSDLVKSYPVRTREGRRDLVAVDSVSLRVNQGQALGLVGESGCGKSTVGRLLLNLEPATAGTVTFAGSPITGLGGAAMRRLRRDMQIVFQDPYASLNSRMTVRQLLAEPYRVHGRHRGPDMRYEIAQLLELVGMGEHFADRYPRQLSGGQRQRVAIARAVALRPRFVVCDEPVSALDVSIQAQIINLLRALRRELGLTYLFISHDLSVVRNLCDQTAVMYLGRVVERAPTVELFTNPRHPYTQTLLSAIPIPDPNRRGRHRVRLQGEVPSPLRRPTGCAFHSRCPLATQRCRDEQPALRELRSPSPVSSNGEAASQESTALRREHEAACHYAETADVTAVG